MAKSKLEDGADAIARDLNGPTGPIKLARIVRRHLAWFEQAQQEGLTWQQMADLLASRGARRPDGGRFTVGHLSSTVWRAKAKAVMRSAEPDGRAARQQTRPYKVLKGGTRTDGHSSSRTDGGEDGVLKYLSRMSSRGRRGQNP